MNQYTTNPDVNTVNADTLPDELRQLRQFVCWKYSTRANGKPTKVPFQANRSGSAAKTNISATWSDYDKAVYVATNNPTMDGIGFVFSKDDPYTGIDF